MHKILLALFLAVIFLFPKSEAFAVNTCSYCAEGVDNGSGQCAVRAGAGAGLVAKKQGCPGGLTPSPDLNDPNCQCIDDSASSGFAPAPAQKCQKTTTLVCNDEKIKPNSSLECPGPGGRPEPPVQKNIWRCSDAGVGPDVQNDSCVCKAGLSNPAPVGAATAEDICKIDKTKCSSAKAAPCPDDRPGVMTAIGCVPTEPQALVEGLIKYGTLAAGGIAFLIMILAALQMITAEGNPEAIKGAQEKFYSAIIGLLLIVFAVLLMQVIGVDILGLKGFGK